MIEVMAPNDTPAEGLFQTTIFLAGSIEMGAAENWQDRLKHDLFEYRVTLYNPRRLDWNSSWKQSIDDPNFSEQVNWELDHIEQADLVVFYFDPATKSPITLMELGFVAGLGLGLGAYHRDVVVCCPDGFWRKGNVEIMCEREGISLTNSYDKFLSVIKGCIKNG